MSDALGGVAAHVQLTNSIGGQKSAPSKRRGGYTAQPRHADGGFHVIAFRAEPGEASDTSGVENCMTRETRLVAIGYSRRRNARSLYLDEKFRLQMHRGSSLTLGQF
jgi:hypothetical protein